MTFSDQATPKENSLEFSFSDWFNFFIRECIVVLNLINKIYFISISEYKFNTFFFKIFKV